MPGKNNMIKDMKRNVAIQENAYKTWRDKILSQAVC